MPVLNAIEEEMMQGGKYAGLMIRGEMLFWQKNQLDISGKQTL